MNLNQFTVKSQEAVHRAAQLASDKQHPAIEKAHLLASLLSEKDQLLSYAFKKLGRLSKPFRPLLLRCRNSAMIMWPWTISFSAFAKAAIPWQSCCRKKG
jgi:hypothetical protein